MIRRASTDDVDEIYTLQKNAFLTEWWDKKTIEEDLQDNQKLYYVMQEDFGIIGFVSFLKSLDEADLLQIVVHDAHVSQGKGTKLLCYALEELKMQGIKKVFLEVRASNPAKQFYLNNGFLPLSIRKKYYGNEDAIVLVKNIL